MSDTELPGGAREPMITALRFVLTALGHATGTFTGNASFTFDRGELGALAGLVIGSRCALAENAGIGDPAERLEWARRSLESDLEAQELEAAVAGRPGAGSQPVPFPDGRARDGRELDPALAAALWAFIAGADAAKRSRRDHEFACLLAGMWAEATAQLHVRIEGIGLDQARAKVAEFVEAQRAIYRSLAAGDL